MKNLSKFLVFGMLAAAFLSLTVVGGTANTKEVQYNFKPHEYNEHEVEFLCCVQNANKKNILESIHSVGRFFTSKALIKAFDISCAQYDKNPELSEFLLYTIFTQPVFVGKKEIFNELCVYFLPRIKDLDGYNYLSPVFFHMVSNQATSCDIMNELMTVSSAGKHFVQQVFNLFPESDTDLYQKNSLLLEVLRVFLHAPRKHKIDLMCHVILYGCIVYGYLCKVGKKAFDCYLSKQCDALKSSYAAKNYLLVEKKLSGVLDSEYKGSHIYLPLLFEVADCSLTQDVVQQNKFLQMCLDSQAYLAFDHLVEFAIDPVVAAQQLQLKVLHQEKMNQKLNGNIMLLDLFIKYCIKNNFDKAIDHCFLSENAEYLKLMQKYLTTPLIFFEAKDGIHYTTVTADLVRSRSQHLKSYLKGISHILIIYALMNIPHVIREESYHEIAATLPISNCSLKLFENPIYSLHRSLMHYKKICAALCKRKFYMQACNNQLTDVVIESNKQ